MTDNAADNPAEDPTKNDAQVSEVTALDTDAKDTPISDDQGVAGNPEADGSMAGDEAGPNGKPQGNVESNRSY
jgi:hypothetical protein